MSFFFRCTIYTRTHPKRAVSLEVVVEELKGCLEPSELPASGGTRPLRACGTRFIAHKVAALGRLVDRLGAYLAHLTTMSEDSSVKAVDRQKLKGYVKKWRNSKYLLGSALFHDILKPSATMCKVLQKDELCVVRAIESVVKTKRSHAQNSVYQAFFSRAPPPERLGTRLPYTSTHTLIYRVQLLAPLFRTVFST